MGKDHDKISWNCVGKRVAKAGTKASGRPSGLPDVFHLRSVRRERTQ